MFDNKLSRERATEEEMAMKKNWEKPELVVLFRGKPEEAVLTHCKHKSETPVAPFPYHDDCNNRVGCCGACSSNANRS